MLERGLETGLMCEVEGVIELIGEEGCGLIVAEAYATAVDLRIAMIFCVISFGVLQQSFRPLFIDFRRTNNYVDCMLTRSESTKSICPSDVGLE